MRRSRSSRRAPSGFSLVELLVVIAIIGILVGLILPAIQAAREAARRMQCSNNLKQMGLGLSNYHNTHQSFPPGMIQSVSDQIFKANAFVLLLPYLEKGNVPWDHNKGTLQASDNAYPTIPLYHCPSDDAKHPQQIFYLNRLYKSPPSSYSLSRGYYDSLGVTEPDWHSPLKPGSGMFGINLPIRTSTVKDGLSNTFAIGEAASGWTICRGVGCTQAVKGMAAFHAYWHPYYVDYADDPEVPTCGSYASTVEPLNKIPATDSLWAGYPHNDFIDAYDTRASYEGGPHHVSSFRSYHPGGALFLLGDGSVQFIYESIDMKTFRAYSTIKDGDLVLER